jgi:hypothetical protein
MEAKAEEKIEFYCGLFTRLYQTVSSMNSEHAVEISLAIFQEIAKDFRSEQIAELRVKGQSREVGEGEELATKRQREAIHKFGVKDIPENLSKREASEILDRLVGFSKKGDSASIAKTVEELNHKWAKKKINQQRKK